MKTLNKTATKTFLSLVDGLAAPGDAKKIDNAPGSFMAVSIDFLFEKDGAKVYAVAHRFEQNGDLCPDPDVEFLVVGDLVYPTAIDQVIGYRRHVELDGVKPVRFSPRGQAGLTSFCNLWMRNIKAQQKEVG